MAESYKDVLGFTWKKEGDKYVQYRGDGSKTGKTKPYTAKAGGAKNKKQKTRGSGAKNKGYKPDPNNPQVGDTKKTKRRRVAGGWTGGETLYWNGSKWVKKGDSSLVPNRAVPGDEKRPEYKLAKSANESLKIDTVKKKVNNNENVSNKENNKKVDNKKVDNKENNKGPNLLDATNYLKGNKNNKEVNYKNFESPEPKEKVDTKKKKERLYIRNPKTKTLVRRTSQKGKQILKLEERKRKLREKRFGKK